MFRMPVFAASVESQRGRVRQFKGTNNRKHMIQKVSHGTIFPRDDGKIIDEHFGVLHTQQDSFSLAHMTAPPAWREPAQVADFDEVLMVVNGALAVEADGERVEVGAGESCI